MSMRWLTPFLLALGLAACTPADLPEPPEVVLLSLVPTDVSLLEQSLAVGLKLRNPNNAPMAVEGLRFTLEINGHSLAKGTSAQAVTVPRLGEAEVSGKAHVATSDLVRQVLAAPQAQGLAYRLSGTVFLAHGGRTAFESDGAFDFAQALGGQGSKRH